MLHTVNKLIVLHKVNKQIVQTTFNYMVVLQTIVQAGRAKTVNPMTRLPWDLLFSILRIALVVMGLTLGFIMNCSGWICSKRKYQRL